MRSMSTLVRLVFVMIALSVYVEPTLATPDEMDFQIICETECDGDARVHYCTFEEYELTDVWGCGSPEGGGAIGYMYNWCYNQAVVSPGHQGPPWFTSWYCNMVGEYTTRSGGFTCSYWDNNCLE
jgi:hypothetical protein